MLETPRQEGNAVHAHHKRLRLLACAALVVTILLPITARSADTSGGPRVCDGPYALCSSAKCQAVGGDPSHVKCTCEGPLQGLNIANSSCRARTDRLTSTFSLWAQPRRATSQPSHHWPAPAAMRVSGPSALTHLAARRTARSLAGVSSTQRRTTTPSPTYARQMGRRSGRLAPRFGPPLPRPNC